MIEFIFMLTRDDNTLTDARAVYASIADSGLHHVGCKDVGLPRDELEALMDDIRANGHTTHLEVVSETPEAHARLGPSRRGDRPRLPDRRHADRAGPGDPGRHRHQVLPLRRPDRRPPVPAARARSARSPTTPAGPSSLGVDGINLLAYRYDGDVDALVDAVVGATSLPVIAAGSVDSTERIHALAERGVWAFTIGTAALDGVIVPGEPLQTQIQTALDAAVA